MKPYKNQLEPWQPGVNLTHKHYYSEFKELVFDIEEMFKVDSRPTGSKDKQIPFVPGKTVVNQVIMGCTEYDEDMRHIDMILRGEL